MMIALLCICFFLSFDLSASQNFGVDGTTFLVAPLSLLPYEENQCLSETNSIFQCEDPGPQWYQYNEANDNGCSGPNVVTYDPIGSYCNNKWVGSYGTCVKLDDAMSSNISFDFDPNSTWYFTEDSTNETYVYVADIENYQYNNSNGTIVFDDASDISSLSYNIEVQLFTEAGCTTDPYVSTSFDLSAALAGKCLPLCGYYWQYILNPNQFGSALYYNRRCTKVFHSGYTFAGNNTCLEFTSFNQKLYYKASMSINDDDGDDDTTDAGTNMVASVHVANLIIFFVFFYL